MHRTIRAGAVAVALLVLGAQAATTQAVALNREVHRNAITLELAGPAFVYSVAYQRMVNANLGLEAGVSILGSKSAPDSTQALFVPVGAKLYLSPKNSTFFVGAGVVYISSNIHTGPFENSSGASIFGNIALGFEHRATGGFVFRATMYGIIGGGSFVGWPGISFGHSF